MAIKFHRLTSEKIALLMHPVNLIKLNLKLAWIALDSIRWVLASGDAKGAWARLSLVRVKLDACEELIIGNARRVPNNFLKEFFNESFLIRKEIFFYAHGGIAEGLASYRRACQMVFTI